MPKIRFSARLAMEYRRLFATCVIDEARLAEVEEILEKIAQHRRRYLQVAEPLSLPWHFVALVHHMEASLDFSRHLHNGDPLTARTVRHPAGRPKTGHPPFTWEESAADALRCRRLTTWKDWSLPGTLYKLEEYNGWGYRLYHPHVLSPYLWSGSNHYRRGKYTADGVWSETAVSRQIGAAVLLRRMAEKGLVDFPEELSLKDTPERPLLVYSMTEWSAYAEELQRFLNRFPGIYLRVDGFPGRKTSAAFRKVTGFYLMGDPRGQGGPGRGY